MYIVCTLSMMSFVTFISSKPCCAFLFFHFSTSKHLSTLMFCQISSIFTLSSLSFVQVAADMDGLPRRFIRSLTLDNSDIHSEEEISPFLLGTNHNQRQSEVNRNVLRCPKCCADNKTVVSHCAVKSWALKSWVKRAVAMNLCPVFFFPHSRLLMFEFLQICVAHWVPQSVVSHSGVTVIFLGSSCQPLSIPRGMRVCFPEYLTEIPHKPSLHYS